VFWNLARHICRTNREEPGFPTMDVRMRARRIGDGDWHRMMRIPDFCTNTPGYTIFGHNDWIATDTGRSDAFDRNGEHQGVR